MTNREAFVKNFNRLLERDQYTQADIAKFLNVASSTVSSWASGKTCPRTDMVQKIAKHFGVSVFELVCKDDGDEERILRIYRILSPRGKEKAVERMEELKQLYSYDTQTCCKSM